MEDGQWWAIVGFIFGIAPCMQVRSQRDVAQGRGRPFVVDAAVGQHVQRQRQIPDTTLLRVVAIDANHELSFRMIHADQFALNRMR